MLATGKYQVNLEQVLGFAGCRLLEHKHRIADLKMRQRAAVYFSESRMRMTSESVCPRIKPSLLPSNDQ